MRRGLTWVDAECRCTATKLLVVASTASIAAVCWSQCVVRITAVTLTGRLHSTQPYGMAPDYLSTMWHPASRLHGRQNLRSANRGQLDVPRATLSSCGVRAFAHAGPSLWTLCPFISRTAIWLLQLSWAILSLISFLSTDFVLSAFGVWSHKRAI